MHDYQIGPISGEKKEERFTVFMCLAGISYLSAFSVVLFQHFITPFVVFCAFLPFLGTLRCLDHLDIWIFGHLDIWTFGYLDHVDIWIFGYLNVWIFGYLDI